MALEIVTELGGLFYLLNLALYLDLYPDFTRPLDAGIGLDPWDFAALLGAWLLGRGERRRRDSVWALLARLAGREPAEPAGRGFRPPRAWRVPPAWLAPFSPEGQWRWSAAGGVLRVMHPRGFAAVAVPRSAAPAGEQLHRELRRLSGSAPLAVPVRASLAREPARPLTRWVARLGSYARERLALALSLQDPRSVGPALLAHRARVLVSPSYVDVVLSLAELPLQVRLAGLDRDPGWIPAAGRHLRFHFT